MNRLPVDKRIHVLTALTAGQSVLETVRATGVARDTVLKLLADVGAACDAYQDQRLRGLPCQRVECNEVLSFDQTGEDGDEGRGEPATKGVWTWTARDDRTGLIPSWLVADRSPESASRFLEDLAGRLRTPGRITSNGVSVYVDPVEPAADVVQQQPPRCRLARLHEALSRRIEQHCHAIALHFMHHNFVRLDQAMGLTPAMAAGVADHGWNIAELVALAS